LCHGHAQQIGISHTLCRPPALRRKPKLYRLGIRYRNAFWSHGQRILAALEQAAEREFLEVIYMTNFSRGHFQLRADDGVDGELEGTDPLLLQDGLRVEIDGTVDHGILSFSMTGP
jgi:hypothetical protein